MGKECGKCGKYLDEKSGNSGKNKDKTGAFMHFFLAIFLLWNYLIGKKSRQKVIKIFAD